MAQLEMSTSRAAAAAVAGKWLAPVAAWGLLIVVWQAAATALGPGLFPGLPAVVTSGLRGVFGGGYALTLLSSLAQLLLGFLIACAIAIPLGALMGVSRFWSDVLQPYAYALYIAPREALLPLLIILFGTETEFRITIVVLFSAFFPLIGTANGVAGVRDGALMEMARSVRASRWRLLSSVLVPGALPLVVAGVRLGLGMSFNGIIIAELWTSVGAGGALNAMASYRQLPAYFALTGLIAVLAVVSYTALGVAERRLRVRYGYEQGRGSQ